MAVRTVLVPWIRHVVERGSHGISGSSAPEVAGTVVAFEAHSKDNGPAEKSRVRRAVRVMAHFAALDPDRRVFECEWAPLIGMTLDARLFVAEALIH